MPLIFLINGTIHGNNSAPVKKITALGETLTTVPTTLITALGDALITAPATVIIAPQHMSAGCLAKSGIFYFWETNIQVWSVFRKVIP